MSADAVGYDDDFDLELDLPGYFIHPEKEETWGVRRSRGLPVVVYRFWDAEPLLLYVGITSTPLKRFKAHSRKSTWWPEIARMQVVGYPNRKAALAAESRAIHTEGPIWNRAGNETGLMWVRR